AQFNEFVEAAIGGIKIDNVFEKERSFDMILRYEEQYRDRIESLRHILIDAADGHKVPLSLVADIRSSSGPNKVQRENVHRLLVISANTSGADLRGVVTNIQEIIDERIDLPTGYRIEYGGQFESEAKASRILFFTSIGAIFAIFLLLYQEFRNLLLAGIILVNLPLALIGGVFAILITGEVVSIPAIIGFITLFGIATRNGILLVSNYRRLGMLEENMREIVIKGSLDRLNPILMTALTAALALIPLAIAGDMPGNEIQSPMAKVILGGLLSSTFLNLLIIPIIYFMISKKSDLKFKQKLLQ
ncbi:MAG: efflux RND transporter permease subunit, partial [Bacteroidota bacterium]